MTKVQRSKVKGQRFLFFFIFFLFTFYLLPFTFSSAWAVSPEPPVRADDPLWEKALSLWQKRTEGPAAREALTVFQSLSQKHPDQVEPLLWSCRIAYFIGERESNDDKRKQLLKESTDLCRQAQVLDPDNGYAVYWLAASISHYSDIAPLLPQIKTLVRYIPERELPCPDELSPEWKSALENWDARWDMNRSRTAVKIWEDTVKQKPESFEAWCWLARAYYWLGEITETKKEQEELYYRGYECGKKAVAMKTRHPGANYWTAANLARWAQRGSIIRIAGNAGEIFGHVRVVDQEEPLYYFGAIPRFMAFSLAHAGFVTRKLVAMMGFNPDNVTQLTLMSIAVEPRFLATHIALAEFAIYAIKNKTLAKEHIDYVLNADPEAYPAYAPENRLDVKKAQKLLEELKK